MAKTYNTFTDVATGDVYTAAAHNDVLENLNNYRVPPMCQVYRSTDLTSYTSNTAISWSAEAFDTDGMWSSGTDVTINTTGVYRLEFYAYVSGSATITSIIPLIAIGGSNYGEQHLPITAGTYSIGTCAFTVSLTASQVVTARVSIAGGSNYIINGSNAALNERSRLTVTWIGQES